MAFYFFSSCKVSRQFQTASEKAAQYVYDRLGIFPIGCCRTNHRGLCAEDTAIVVCNNCATILGENTEASVLYLWELIDRDPNFPFPDYQGEKMTLQDCWGAFDRPSVQDAVRSLLRKMNITVVELAKNRGETLFCGVNLLSPCTASNAALAPKRYVQQYPHMFTPMSPPEQKAHFIKHCREIETEKVVCYCKFCTDGIRAGGKDGRHLLELIFPD